MQAAAAVHEEHYSVEALLAYAQRIGWQALAQETILGIMRSRGAGGSPEQLARRRQQDIGALMRALREHEAQRHGGEPTLRVLLQTRELMARVGQLAPW